jgi:hypothetical protein
VVVALLFAAVIAVLVLFQLALALGAPLGRFAWGGGNRDVLPRRLRIASAVSILIYALLVLPAFDLAGILDIVPNGVAQVAAWVVFAYLAVGVLMNAISRSKPERNTMTPVALVLAVLALIIAIGGPVPRSFDGMVLDDGSPVFCTTVMESYPPQCGDSPVVEGWDWESVAHEDASGVKWGEYRFEGVLDQGVLRVTTTPSAG